MKIDIWSDYVCPYCYAGLKKFQRALNELEKLNDIEINYRSFQLYPDIKHGDYTDAVLLLADAYNVSREKALEMMQESIDYVNSEDLVYDYKKMIPANTFDAHRLTQYAKEFNKATALSNSIFKAHFEEGLDIGDHDTLSNLAAEIGLDKSKVLDMLNSDSFLDVIERDKLEAIKLNFDLIPTIIFEDGTIITGVLSDEDFLKVIH